MTQIIGHHELTHEQITLINEITTHGEVTRTLVKKVRGCNLNNGEGVDQRWAEIAETHFQQAFMALKRSVGKPEVY